MARPKPTTVSSSAGSLEITLLSRPPRSCSCGQVHAAHYTTGGDQLRKTDGSLLTKDLFRWLLGEIFESYSSSAGRLIEAKFVRARGGQMYDETEHEPTMPGHSISEENDDSDTDTGTPDPSVSDYEGPSMEFEVTEQEIGKTTMLTSVALLENSSQRREQKRSAKSRPWNARPTTTKVTEICRKLPVDKRASRAPRSHVTLRSPRTRTRTIERNATAMARVASSANPWRPTLRRFLSRSSRPPASTGGQFLPLIFTRDSRCPHGKIKASSITQYSNSWCFS